MKRAIALTKSRRVFPNLVVVFIILSTYAGGLFALFSDFTSVSLVGAVLVSQAMILSWYLSHDCAHGVVSGRRRGDELLGELLSWINGYSYFAFSDYMVDHLRHHAKQVDLVGIETAEFVAALPAPLRRLMLAAEYCQVPLSHSLLRTRQRLDLLFHGSRRDRVRVVTVFVARTTLLTAMFMQSWQAFVLYLVAVSLRIHCVRFVDAFQHTYPEEKPEKVGRPRGHAFEQAHTFSFPVAYRHTWLNLLILNFGYHNAHHALPSCPWYNLPQLHRLLYEPLPDMAPPGFTPPRAGFLDLLKTYHRHRMRRLAGGSQGQAYDDGGHFSFAEFYGAYTDKLLG